LADESAISSNSSQDFGVGIFDDAVGISHSPQRKGTSTHRTLQFAAYGDLGHPDFIYRPSKYSVQVASLPPFNHRQPSISCAIVNGDHESSVISERISATLDETRFVFKASATDEADSAAIR
jgi:hypothetical protein